MQPTERFLALTERIDVLIKDPSAIKAPFTRLARPFLRRFGWQPKPHLGQSQDLWRALQGERSDANLEALRLLYQGAIDELEENITAAERTYVVYRRIPVAYVAWLQRLQVMLERTQRFLENPEDPDLFWMATGADFVSVLPPLSLELSEASSSEATPPPNAPAGTPPAASDTQEAVFSVELGAVDHLLELARQETASISRKRRFLEASRRFLLEASAALPLEEHGVQQRLQHISREMIRLNRLQASGLSSEVSLLHQARTAVSRGDRQLLYASLLALDAAARATGDARLAAYTRAGLQQLSPDAAIGDGVQRSLAASAAETLGQETMALIKQAYQAAPENLPITNETPAYEARLFREYFAEGAMEQTLFAILSTDGLFEVGGALSPTRIVENEYYFAAVTTPTPKLRMEQSRDVQDVPNALLEDPRTLLLSLATGRLLTRRFLRQEVRPKARTVMQSEARVYVIDGSGSMLGPRARMRDAILLSEIVTLQKRLRTQSKFTRSTIYYRYFNEKLGPVHKVDTDASANFAIDHILSRIRTGGTNIDLALTNSFTQIREARALDPNLAKAQIVLITDGDAEIDEEALARAREGLDDLPIGVSVIALGMENPALKDLVAKQRASGQSAFYHFVSDEMLLRYCQGTFDPRGALHIPPQQEGNSEQDEARALQTTVGELLDEMATLERKRDIESLERLDLEAAARQEMSVEAHSLSEGERAKIEALHQNRRALQQRFQRWFPEENTAQTPFPEGQEKQDIEAILLIHAALCEMIGVLGGSELTRKADAIDLLERLLVDARLTPRRYEELLANFAGSFVDSLEALHDTITPKQA